VALAKLALEGANFLLLDEPTNHLDIPSQEVLEQALETFPGTILLVSHDRYLIDALATQVWVITPEARALEVFVGGFEAYSKVRQQMTEARKPHPATRTNRRPKEVKLRSPVEKRAVEARIEEIEDELSQVVHQLDQAGDDLEQVRLLGSRYAELEADLEAQVAIWERLARDG